MKTFLKSVMAASAFVVCACSASAAIVQYDFEATVTSVGEPLVGGPVAVGNPVVGSFLVETTPVTSYSAYAYHAISELSVLFGSTYEATSPAGGLRLNTFGSLSMIIVDATSGQGLTAPTVNSSNTPDYFSMILENLPAITSLPQSIDFSTARGDRAGLRFNVVDSNSYRISVSSFGVSPVPLPAAGLLLVGALGALGAMRRRRAPAV